MSALTDIITVAKNLVTAVNGAAQTYQNVQGAQSASAISAATVVKTTAGRVCSVSVTTSGSGAGLIYDANSTSNTSRPIYVIPMSTGVFVVNLPTSFGIVVAPGTSQVVTVSWS